MLREKFKNLRQGYKAGGFYYLISSLTSRLPEWLFRYYHSVFIRGDEIKIVVREYKEYETRLAGLDDLEIIRQIDDNIDKVRQRLERGDPCVIVLKNSQPVTISWSASGRMYNRFAGNIVDTDPDGFFLYGAYSLPEERMKGLFLLCFRLHFEHHRKQGRIIKYGVVDILNKFSIRSHQRMGFKIIGESYYLAIFGISICYYKEWPNRKQRFHIFFKRPPENLKWV